MELKKQYMDMKCKVCGYIYNPQDNKPAIGKDTLFEDLPDKYSCPQCGAKKRLFTEIE